MRSLTPERRLILAAMDNGRVYTPSAIATLLNKERTSITHIMRKMAETGHLAHVAYGQYQIPATQICPCCGRVIHHES